jgi:hypothetical protein
VTSRALGNFPAVFRGGRGRSEDEEEEREREREREREIERERERGRERERERSNGAKGLVGGSEASVGKRNRQRKQTDTGATLKQEKVPTLTAAESKRKSYMIEVENR